MFEKFEIKGLWWLPENPDKKLTGTLSYDPEDGAVLELVGSSFETPIEIFNAKEYDIINGQSSDEITLYKCYSQSMNVQGIMSSKYFANFVFKGKIFNKVSDIKFRYAVVGYNYLESWMARSSFLVTPNNENLTVSTMSQKPIVVTIDNNLRISLTSHVLNRWKVGTWKDGTTITLEQKALFEIETRIETHFEDILEIAYKLAQFLTLAINEPIQILAFTAKIDPDNQDERTGIDIFLTIRRELIKEDTLLHPLQMPLSLDSISGRFDEILRNWFEKCVLLRPIFNLYFALSYNDKMYRENIFLNLISCLESYHRRRLGGVYLSEKNYGEFKKKIIESLPVIDDEKYPDFKTKFIAGLEYGNEISLRKRLSSILLDNTSIISKYIEYQDQFIEKAVATRNYLTHYDKKLEKNALSDIREFYDFNLKLKMLVEICIFKELGLNNDEIEKIFSRNRHYSFMLTQMAKKV